MTMARSGKAQKQLSGKIKGERLLKKFEEAGRDSAEKVEPTDIEETIETLYPKKKEQKGK